MRELSLHILDLMQNSIEAGATRVSLLIEEDPDGDWMIIRITDDGRGMSEEMVAKVTDPFVTTRTTRKVGLGIPLFDAAARQTGGDFSIRSVLGEGTVVEARFGYAHIDRAPLGDIVGTVITFLAGNPNLELDYLHKFKERTFTFQTEEIRRALDDVAINHPMIIGWIQDYLKSGLAEIYGGEIE
jgi:signal transduction histidine kinase